jgi:hypothetical protein
MSVPPVFAGADGSCPPAGVPVGAAGATPGAVDAVTVVVVFVVVVAPFVVFADVVEFVFELLVAPEAVLPLFVVVPFGSVLLVSLDD